MSENQKQHMSTTQEWARLLPSCRQAGAVTSRLCVQMAKVQEAVTGEVTPLASLPDLTDAQAIQKVNVWWDAECLRCQGDVCNGTDVLHHAIICRCTR